MYLDWIIDVGIISIVLFESDNELADSIEMGDSGVNGDAGLQIGSFSGSVSIGFTGLSLGPFSGSLL
jgi:hypothetical protein